MFVPLLIFLVTVILVYLKVKNQYWKKRNVEGPDPTILVGNIGDQFLGRKHMGVILVDIYNKYKNLPYVGIYKTTTPCLLIRDPEFVKNIFTAHFKSFSENDIHVDKKTDPLAGRNPFVLKGEEWKKARHILAPCFTSGKMKMVFPLIDNTGKVMVEYLKKNQSEPLEAKELCSKFTLDNVASCAFGVDGRCFIEPYSNFREIAEKFLTPGNLQAAIMALSVIAPWLAKIIPLKVVSAEVEDRLREIVRSTVEYREKNNIVRQDFIHFMNQIRVQSNGEFTFEDMTAQASAFFIDGFESSAAVMSYVLFHLANNPEKQEILRDEISSKIEDNGGVLTFELLSEMPYLDACFTESLRLVPLAETTGKVCTETYTYTPSEKSDFCKFKPITIQPGTCVIIPIGGLNRDPLYYEDPDKFIPERHLNRNDSEAKYTIKPFSDGPRACLGQRFGGMQVKLGICYIMKNFSLSVNSKTQIPLKIVPWNFTTATVGGLWLNIKEL